MKFNIQHKIYGVLLLTILNSCYQQERNCTDFRTGKFKSETIIDGTTYTSTFERNDSIQIETFQGVVDTFLIRWTNDCEYVIQNKKPKNMKERKMVQMKILTTKENTYIFEYNYVGEALKQKGTVYKVEN